MSARLPAAAWLLPICAWTAAGQASETPRSAEDYVRAAVEKNRELVALRQRVAEARGLLKQAGMRPAPSVQVSGTTGSLMGSPGKEEYAAGYTQPLEMGGKRDKRVLAAEKGVAVAEASLAERSLAVAMEVKLRYLDTVTERTKLAALARVLESYRASLRLMEARVKEGDAAPLDVQMLRVEASRVEAQRSLAAGRMAAAESDLRRLCGLGAAQPLALAERYPAAGGHYELEALRRQALERRPDLRSAWAGEEKGAAELRLTEAQGRADITISAEYALRNERIGNLYGLTAGGQMAPIRDRDSLVTGGVSIPLFARRRNEGNVEAAAARAVGARTWRQHLEASIPLEVQAAWQRWRAAEETLRILDSDVAGPAEKNLEVMRQAYELGQLRLLDVLNEQRRLVETQMARADGEADARRSWIELERTVGGDLK